MNVGVIGVALSKFGELWQISPRQLVREVGEKALRDAQLNPSEIDALYIGNMLSGILGGQENIGALFAEELGITAPAFKVEGACASGGLAIHNAILGILSGQYRKVLVVGVEKMTDHRPEEVTVALMGAGSEVERTSGLTFPGLYALMAKEYMDTYHISEKELAAVAVKNHFHGSLNPNAQFQNQITIEKVMASPCVADPLKLLDCSPISDGASAVVLSSEKTISKRNSVVWIVGSAAATDSLGLPNRKSLTSLPATLQASHTAYKQVGVSASTISVAEVHDCFTIAELLALEDLGFYEKGRSGKAVVSGDLTLGTSKKLVVNTSGGLKACGHPVGATGVKQIVEVVEQLRGTAGKRQVKNAHFGLTHNVGGSGAVAVVHILKN
jgi:acetyl-CoA C-acetyltransferase